MISIARIALLLLVIAVTSGCTQKMLVSLVPDPDGKIGNIFVESAGGIVTIDTPYQATTIGNAEAPPSAPEYVGKEKLDTIFKEALSIQPRQPIHFLLYFKQDTTLTLDSTKLLPDIMAAIKERNANDISVIGHTDTLGSKEYNTMLSKDRATAVKTLLVKQGVDAAAVRTTSHGKENPLIPTVDNVSEPRNRRVEVVVR
jgi:outer membrane protein OmpA-like peptidoglycan-associated protein